MGWGNLCEFFLGGGGEKRVVVALIIIMHIFGTFLCIIALHIGIIMRLFRMMWDRYTSNKSSFGGLCLSCGCGLVNILRYLVLTNWLHHLIFSWLMFVSLLKIVSKKSFSHSLPLHNIGVASFFIASIFYMYVHNYISFLLFLCKNIFPGFPKIRIMFISYLDVV